MTVVIPEWLIWTACIVGGIGVVIPILFFAVIGFMLRNIRLF